MPESPDRIILAADVGGTHLTLALMARRQGRFDLLRRWQGSTQAEISLAGPIRQFLAAWVRDGGRERPALAAIAAAGPLEGRRIGLTNAAWAVDAPALEAELGLPVALMNDFTAVSYGVLGLDPGDPAQLTPLPHPGGALPAAEPRGPVLVVGAGTGLGVGFVTRPEGIPRAFPSQGGHVALPVLDEETFALWRHFVATGQGLPDAERAVSGSGIAAIHAFLVGTGRVPASPLDHTILALPGPDRPAAIAAHADRDEACARTMDLFVALYARVCSELTAVFLPTGGLFLAGGIAARNASRFLDGDRFMRGFEANCRPHIHAILRATPVHLALDYGCSLAGAAYAGCLAMDEGTR